MKEKFICRLFVTIIILSNARINDTADVPHCDCNFANACNPQGKRRENWAQYLPQGVDKLRNPVGPMQNPIYLCEDNTVAILFDPNSKIPLYSAIVITDQQLLAGGSGRPDAGFQISKNISPEYQQKTRDYKGSSKLNPCYEVKGTKGRCKPAQKWVNAAEKKAAVVKKAVARKAVARKAVGGKAVAKKEAQKATAKSRSVNKRNKLKDCIPTELLITPIHKGHLAASNYFRGDERKMRATFKYTNTVPQFGSFNSGPWRSCEQNLVKWGERNLAKGATNVQMYILVGAVPSTVYGASQERWFGKRGFSNFFQEDDYPVNVPNLLWTAACLMYEYDDQGKPKQVTQNTAFLGINQPESDCNMINIPSLTKMLSSLKGGVNLFPKSSPCTTNKNYIPLRPTLGP